MQNITHIDQNHFDEYYNKFIKPSNEEILAYKKISRGIKINILIRSILVICALIFTYVVYGPDISNKLTQLSETSAKNTSSPLIDEICKVGMLSFFGAIIAFLLLYFIFSPTRKLANKIKSDLVPKIIKFFGESLAYSSVAGDPAQIRNIIESFGMTKQNRLDSFYFGDKSWNIKEKYSIKGSFNNKKINILKLNLSKGSGKRIVEVFEGILIFDETTKPKFQDEVTVKVNNIVQENDKNLLGLENQKKLFTIICKNESDKNLIAADFLQYLLSLTSQFKSKAECRIHTNQMLILLRKPKDPIDFDNSSLKENPPFYKSANDRMQKIAALLLAYDF